MIERPPHTAPDTAGGLSPEGFLSGDSHLSGLIPISSDEGSRKDGFKRAAFVRPNARCYGRET